MLCSDKKTRGLFESPQAKTFSFLKTFCLNTTYFVYDGTYYQQVFGTAMRSPVSAVIANLVMEDVEQRALASSSGEAFVLETLCRRCHFSGIQK